MSFEEAMPRGKGKVNLGANVGQAAFSTSEAPHEGSSSSLPYWVGGMP